MSHHEIECFARVLSCPLDDIRVSDFIHAPPSKHAIEEADMLLFGGSGDYSVAGDGPWLPAALDMMQMITEMNKPTYASCWGFQAMAKALGGSVESQPHNAEVGTFELSLTPQGRQDPVFSKLPSTFEAQMGHEDVVTEIPKNAVRLASSSGIQNQAFCIKDKPIYCTQFHPELKRADLILRLKAYPKYVRQTTGLSMEEFILTTKETPDVENLVGRIRDYYFQK